MRRHRLTSDPIQLYKPRLSSLASATKYLQQAEDAAVFSNYGPLVRQFETAVAKYLGIRDPNLVVSCTSATLGIQGALEVLGLERVRCPDFTFAATGLAIKNSGAVIELVDVGDDDWMSLGWQTYEGGEVLVLPFGAPFKSSFTSKSGTRIIDAAASFASSQGGLSEFTDSVGQQVIVFSLHATKLFGVGEGGVIAFSDEALAQEFRNWTRFGFSDKRISTLTGTNAKMSEITAAYGLGLFDEWEQLSVELQALRSKARKVHSRSSLSSAPEQVSEAVSPYWLVVTRQKEETENLAEFLSAKGIPTRSWWAAPLSAMPAFEGSHRLDSGTTAARLTETVLGLPFHPNLTDAHLESIEEALCEWGESDRQQS